MRSFLQVYILVIVLIVTVEGQYMTGGAALLQKFKNLTQTRPVYKKTDRTIVYVSFKLTSLQQVDGPSQTVSINSFMSFNWINKVIITVTFSF